MQSPAQRRKLNALERAAYGPLPPKVDPAWLFTPHPYPEWQRVLIDGPTCERLLQVMVKNRKPKAAKIARFARQQLQNHWPFTHQGWAMDSEGHFQDAGNRAAGLMLANEYLPGIELDVMFFVGMPPENFKYLDQNTPRSGGDTFDVDDEKYATHLSSATDLTMQILQWRDDAHFKYAQFQIANDERWEAAAAYGETIREGLPLGFRVRSYLKGTSVGAVACAYHLIRQVAPKDIVDAWFDALVMGADKSEQVAVLRNVLLTRAKRGNPKYDMFIQAALIIKAWDGTVSGSRKTTIRFPERTTEPFPWQPLPWPTEAKEGGQPAMTKRKSRLLQAV